MHEIIPSVEALQEKLMAHDMQKYPSVMLPEEVKMQLENDRQSSESESDR
ncbi:MAG: hypothetical protein GF313_02060 [Caldithrix sp.]|nr:hypothetical protein [Caldithrix sp.]